jgi:hypothetical protein
MTEANAKSQKRKWDFPLLGSVLAFIVMLFVVGHMPLANPSADTVYSAPTTEHDRCIRQFGEELCTKEFHAKLTDELDKSSHQLHAFARMKRAYQDAQQAAEDGKSGRISADEAVRKIHQLGAEFDDAEAEFRRWR